MSYSRVQTIMDEYGLEIDDIRWYVSIQLSGEILAAGQEQRDLIQLIWSGKLGDRLYRFEERFLEDLEIQWSEGLIEESKIREILSETRVAKRRRNR